MIRNLLALCCSICVGALGLQARTWYVATNGNDYALGNFAHPWRHINFAVSAQSGVTAGDTIFVRAGNYPETVSPQISGAAARPIRLSNYAVEQVSLDPGCFRFNSGINYWKLRGFRVLNSLASGVRVTGTHAVGFLDVSFCVLSHHKEDGIALSGPDFGGISVSHCDISYNGEVAGVPSGVEGSGIVMYESYGKLWARHNLIANNWAKGIAHGSSGEFHGDSSAVEYNLIINNYETGMDWLADNSSISWNYFSCNGIRDPEAGEWGDAGLSLDYVACGNLVAFNVIRTSGQIELSPRGSNNRFYNNTIVKDHYYTTVPGSPYSAAILLFGGDGVHNEFRNNIVVNYCSQPEHHFCIIAEEIANYTEQIWSNNLYWCPNSSVGPPANRPFKIYGFPGGIYVTLAQVKSTYPQQESGSLWADPKFTSYRDSLFTLAQSSPAIDRGRDLGFPYYDAAPDLGAFEYTATDSIAPQPPSGLKLQQIFISDTLKQKGGP